MRHRLTLGVLALLDVIVVAAIAAAYGHGSAIEVTAAIVLAPIATLAVGRAATRLRPGAFAGGASLVYVALPFVAAPFFLVTARQAYLHQVAPALVGLQGTAWFALGVALTVGVAWAPRTVSAAVALAAAVAALIVWDPGRLADVRSGIHETGWSVTFSEWLPIAGTIGAARRSPALAATLAGWLCFFVVRGAQLDYYDESFWRSLAPATPAIALLLSSLALLVPRLRSETPPVSSPDEAR